MKESSANSVDIYLHQDNRQITDCIKPCQTSFPGKIKQKKKIKNITQLTPLDLKKELNYKSNYISLSISND